MNTLSSKCFFGFSVFLILSILHFGNLTAQSNPYPLKPGITVTKVIPVFAECANIAIDPITQNFFYIRYNGDIHELFPDLSSFIDSLIVPESDHGIEELQGMCFHDSSLFLIGNKSAGLNTTQGIIMRGDLQPDGSRIWTTAMITDTIPLGSTAFDHGYNGVVVNPAGDSLFFNAGSRTDHGEIQTNLGAFPNTRDVPLTSAVFSIPINSNNLFLPRDSASLAPFIYAEGTRNSFALAFNSFGELIGLENSGDRDDPDEMNWLRKNHHYGFPWILGGDVNPQQFPGYDPESDFMVNKHRYAYIKGYFYNDSTFPPMPPDLIIAPGFSSMGPDADYFRDTTTGLMMNASDSGIPVQTFTPHRAPVGLIFDLDSVLSYDYRGDAFMLGEQLRGDSTGAIEGGGVGTLLDSSQDLVHVRMVKNSVGDNYNITCERIVGGFIRPVDAVMKGNHIYVIEYDKTDFDASIWDITMPEYTSVEESHSQSWSPQAFPNPFSDFVEIDIGDRVLKNAELTINDVAGKTLWRQTFNQISSTTKASDVSKLPPGVYLVRINSSGKEWNMKVVKQ